MFSHLSEALKRLRIPFLAGLRNPLPGTRSHRNIHFFEKRTMLVTVGIALDEWAATHPYNHYNLIAPNGLIVGEISITPVFISSRTPGRQFPSVNSFNLTLRDFTDSHAKKQVWQIRPSTQPWNGTHTLNVFTNRPAVFRVNTLSIGLDVDCKVETEIDKKITFSIKLKPIYMGQLLRFPWVLVPNRLK